MPGFCFIFNNLRPSVGFAEWVRLGSFPSFLFVFKHLWVRWVKESLFLLPFPLPRAFSSGRKRGENGGF